MRFLSFALIPKTIIERKNCQTYRYDGHALVVLLAHQQKCRTQCYEDWGVGILRHKTRQDYGLFARKIIG